MNWPLVRRSTLERELDEQEAYCQDLLAVEHDNFEGCRRELGRLASELSEARDALEPAVRAVERISSWSVDRPIGGTVEVKVVLVSPALHGMTEPETDVVVDVVTTELRKALAKNFRYVDRTLDLSRRESSR